MTSVASTTVKNANSNDSMNPFEGLRPPVRSQEDEIRKGIFGQALRLLYTASDDEKQKWRLAIEEALTAKRPKSQMKSKENAEPTTLKRQRDEDGESYEVHEASSGPVPTHTEFIASYLRTLLDKVVGLSLLALSVDALRVFFVILGVPLPSIRSKMALYNTLASFHYTHFEKLGKRVSTSHNADAQQKRDAAMMTKLLKPRPPAPLSVPLSAPLSVSSSSLPLAGTNSHTTSAAKPSTAVSSEKGTPPSSWAVNRSIFDRVHGNAAAIAKGSPAARSVRAPSGTTKEKEEKRTAIATTGNKVEQRNVEKEDDKEMLEVVYAPKVFASAVQQQPLPAVGPENDDDDDDEWTVGYLEKKVASVVQLYDPVTSAVVVKKLAQMGYRKPNAVETVEKILHSFHARELIYYDNGIAYLL